MHQPQEPRLATRAKDARQRQRGFMLVHLLALCTLTGILLTKAMPSVIAEVQRDKEEELIFRGEAMREAIKRYKARTGSYPTKLDDLMKVRPRILRKLYRDPMTLDGEWDLLTTVQSGGTGQTTGLPIVGVRTKCSQEGFKEYKGETDYSEWKFTAAEDPLNPGAPNTPSQGSTPQSPTPGSTPGTPPPPGPKS